jgi:hypothetical protein
MKANDFWGPHVWKMIHCSALCFTPNKKHSFFSFIYSLPDLLPCHVCRLHLRQNLQTFPLTEYHLQNKDTLFYWTYTLHDIVNKQLGKLSPPLDTIKQYYIHHLEYPHFWGPSYWFSIHSISSQFSPSSSYAFKRFIYSLPALLPCSQCSSLTTQSLRAISLTDDFLNSKESLLFWSYQFHDYINTQLGKSSPSFQSIRNFYLEKLDCKDCSIH